MIRMDSVGGGEWYERHAERMNNNSRWATIIRASARARKHVYAGVQLIVSGQWPKSRSFATKER